MQTVTILCKSDVVPNPIIQDVSVAIYNQASVFVTSGTTNSNGIFSALLPEATYIAYFYKQGLNIVQPITLVVSPISKEFLVYGHLKIAKESLDTNLCCIYGYARDISGKEENEVELIINQIALNIITNSLIFNSPIRVHSDKNGYFEFYLLRNTKYEVHYEGYGLGDISYKIGNTGELLQRNFQTEVSCSGVIFKLDTESGELHIINECTDDVVFFCTAYFVYRDALMTEREINFSFDAKTK
jgi:hypothetical protein